MVVDTVFTPTRRAEPAEADRIYRIGVLTDVDRHRLEAALRAYERNQPSSVLASQAPAVDYLRRSARVAGAVGMLLVWACLAAGYGVPGAEFVILDGSTWTLEIAIALVVWGTLVEVQPRWVHLHRLPRGLFLFPGHAVEVGRHWLTVRSIGTVDAVKATFEGSGADALVRIDTFAHRGPVRSFTGIGKARAEQILKRLAYFRHRLADRSDLPVRSHADVEVPLDPVMAMTTPQFRPWALALDQRLQDLSPHLAMLATALVAGIVLAAPLRAVRNVGSEEAQWAVARQAGTREALTAYLAHGTDHRTEARGALMRLDIDAALRGISIQPLRVLPVRYPEAGLDKLARDEIGRRYAEATQRFQGLTPGRRPELLAYMESALRRAELTGDWFIDVVYERPAPVGGPTGFRPEYMAWNERRVVIGLQKAFKAVFPAGQLGVRLGDKVQAGRPAITIAYAARPVPPPSRSPSWGAEHPAVRLSFQVRFTADGVSPPPLIRVEPEAETSFPLRGSAGPAAEVYRSMTNNASALLEKQLRAALF